MKVICSVLAAVTLACAIAGCGGPKTPKRVFMERQQKYRRIAIVCAPKDQADPGYASLILGEAERMAPNDLTFPEKVDCLFDASVDTASTPPRVDLDNASDYDAVVALVYSYGAGHAYLDFHMIDTATGEQIWHNQFDRDKDPVIMLVLLRHGYWAPTAINDDFYGNP